MTNTITLSGNLVDDPELRFTPAGAAVCNFRMAHTPRSFDKKSQEWVDGETLFMSVSVWRAQGEHVAESLTKGNRVVVTGKLKARSYETREGEKRTVFEVDADEVSASLMNATATLSRAGKGAGAHTAPYQPAQQPTGPVQKGPDPWATPAPAGDAAPPF